LQLVGSELQLFTIRWG